jgi:hypothetical protein
VTITAASAGLSPHVAAWPQHPGSQRWLVDLPQATHVSLGRTRAPKEDGNCYPLAPLVGYSLLKGRLQDGFSTRPGISSLTCLEEARCLDPQSVKDDAEYKSRWALTSSGAPMPALTQALLLDGPATFTFGTVSRGWR